jgi:circadian clock protein KaiC
MADGRLGSGHAPLDEILEGGLPGNGISILMGLPGTGKTILAQQYAFRNADPERPVVYFSTLSEPLEKIIRFGQSLRFFTASAVGTSLFYEDLGQTASRDGLAGVAERVMATLKERQPGLMIIDGFRALQVFADSDAAYRRFLHQLAGRLSVFPAASLWVGIYEANDIPALPEFAIADAILELRTVRAGLRDQRFLEIHKLRGSGFRSGQHAYRIDVDGLHLFPRLADLERPDDQWLGDERVPFGLAALDDMLAGGVYPGSSTIIAGPAGSGKTVLGLHFILSGATRGEPGVIAALQENPAQLGRLLRGFGYSIEDHPVTVMYRSPVDIYLDEWVYDLLDAVQRTGARRVLLDSLGDLEDVSPDETRFREFMYSLTQRLSRRATSLVMTYESARFPGVHSLSSFAASHLSDNVIVLNQRAEQGGLYRDVSVPKFRASAHDLAIRQFTIDSRGISIDGLPATPRSSG